MAKNETDQRHKKQPQGNEAGIAAHPFVIGTIYEGWWGCGRISLSQKKTNGDLVWVRRPQAPLWNPVMECTTVDLKFLICWLFTCIGDIVLHRIWYLEQDLVLIEKLWSNLSILSQKYFYTLARTTVLLVCIINRPWDATAATLSCLRCAPLSLQGFYEMHCINNLVVSSVDHPVPCDCDLWLTGVSTHQH